MKFLFRPIVAWPGAALAARRLRRERNPSNAPRSRNSCRPASSTNPACARAAADGGRKESFGDYAAHYAVITDFNSGMDASVKPLNNLMQRAACVH